MEEQERLTMEFVISLMDKSYTLVWVDYKDNLDNCRDTIQKCLEERSCESLWEKVDEWYGDAEWEAVREIVSKLKDECIRFHDFGEEEVDKFFQEHEDEIREEIYDRNDSDTLKELLKNTDDIPVRVEMLSNYDCINSNWLESQEGYRYKESYFGDMIDALNLNPAKVKKMLVEKGYTVFGRFPNKKYRDGKEQVSYEQFYHELINSCCGANLLTYIGKVSLQLVGLGHGQPRLVEMQADAPAALMQNVPFHYNYAPNNKKASPRVGKAFAVTGKSKPRCNGCSRLAAESS